MKADEYDLFIDDPTDYIIRVYLPRVFESLEPLEQYPTRSKCSFMEDTGGILTICRIGRSSFGEGFTNACTRLRPNPAVS